MNIAYAKDSNGEWDESPRIKNIKYFHYRLSLNNAGDITGGYFYRDSSVIDMLWVPRRPVQPSQPGNEAGNPYIDVDKVLAIWRDSVPEETRKQWLVVDPAPEDRVALDAEVNVSTETTEGEADTVDGSETTEAEETVESTPTEQVEGESTESEAVPTTEPTSAETEEAEATVEEASDADVTDSEGDDIAPNVEDDTNVEQAAEESVIDEADVDSLEFD